MNRKSPPFCFCTKKMVTKKTLKQVGRRTTVLLLLWQSSLGNDGGQCDDTQQEITGRAQTPGLCRLLVNGLHALPTQLQGGMRETF